MARDVCVGKETQLCALVSLESNDAGAAACLVLQVVCVCLYVIVLELSSD